jgi:hypothetical protein
MKTGYRPGPCALETPTLKDEETRLLDRQYVIDETVGTVEVFGEFKAWRGNVYDFRIEEGKIRYVHMIAGGSPHSLGKLTAPAYDVQTVGLGLLLGIPLAAVGMALQDGFASLIGVHGSRKGARGSRKGAGRGPKGV